MSAVWGRHAGAWLSSNAKVLSLRDKLFAFDLNERLYDAGGSRPSRCLASWCNTHIWSRKLNAR